MRGRRPRPAALLLLMVATAVMWTLWRGERALTHLEGRALVCIPGEGPYQATHGDAAGIAADAGQRGCVAAALGAQQRRRRHSLLVFGNLPVSEAGTLLLLLAPSVPAVIALGETAMVVTAAAAALLDPAAAAQCSNATCLAAMIGGAPIVTHSLALREAAGTDEAPPAAESHVDYIVPHAVAQVRASPRALSQPPGRDGLVASWRHGPAALFQQGVLRVSDATAAPPPSPRSDLPDPRTGAGLSAEGGVSGDVVLVPHAADVGALQLLIATLRGVGCSADVVVLAAGDIAAVRIVVAGDAQAEVLQASRTAADNDDDDAAAAAAASELLKSAPGRYRRALVAPVDTVFQADPFAAAAYWGGASAVSLFASEPQSLEADLGRCVPRDAGGAAGVGPGAICPAAVVGPSGAVQRVLEQALALYHQVPSDLRPTCSFSQLLSRAAWGGSLASIDRIAIHSGGGVVLDLEGRSPLHRVLVDTGKVALGADGLAVAAVTRYSRTMAPAPHDTTGALQVRSKGGDAAPSEAVGEEEEAVLARLRVTYESCSKHLEGRSRTKRIKNVLWLHFPKCGTSLGTVLHGYLCQAAPSPQSNPRTSLESREAGLAHRRTCTYCRLEMMRGQGTPAWDGKILNLLPRNPEERHYCDWSAPRALPSLPTPRWPEAHPARQMCRSKVEPLGTSRSEKTNPWVAAAPV